MVSRSYSYDKPVCFGDSDEYSETSSHCRTCPYSSDCADAIRSSINKVAIRSAKPVVTPRKYYTSTTSSSTKVATKAGNAMIRPVKFNHEKPLASQYITYVGYDVAEAVASRAVDLVRSCRDEYERELFDTGTQDADN